MALDHLPPVSVTDPSADDWTRGFWEEAANEQLVATCCDRCGTFRMPPGRFCRACGSQDFTWKPLPGTGTVFTCTVVRSGTGSPYVPAVVEADGAPGVRFVSAVVDCNPDEVAAGTRVHVVWHRVSDTLTLPYWTLAE